MNWMQIASAVMLGLMIALLVPRAKAMLEHSPQAKPGDWTAALVPILGVVGFVLLLMSMV